MNKGMNNESHNVPGIHKVEMVDGVITWCIVLCDHSNEEVIDQNVINPLNRMFNDYFKQVLRYNCYGVFQNECSTGFKVLTSKRIDEEDITTSLLGVYNYINSVKVRHCDCDSSCYKIDSVKLNECKSIMQKFYDEVLIHYEKSLCENLCDSYSGECINSRGERYNG